MLRLLFERNFAPHGFCLQWEPALLWLHAVSDISIGVAYYAIPVALASLVLRRHDLAFGWIFWLFALFILACGTTHFIDVWVLWEPVYGFQGLLKAFTAVLSILTAVLLWHIMPKLLVVPTPAQFRRVADQLTDETVRHEHTVEQLRRSEESFQLLVESVRDCAMFMLDTSGYVTSWNAGATHVKQYTAEEIVGRHFSCFYSSKDRARGEPIRMLEHAANAGSCQQEGIRVRKDGSQFIAEVVINPVHDRDGTLVGFASITRDIEKRKQAETELEQARAALAHAQKMEAVGQLTGGIAHDFNNLLTAILGSVELLDGCPTTSERSVGELTEVIGRAAERGAELTRRLLAFSRKQALAPAVVDISRLVAEMSEMLRRTLGESIAIETVLPGGLWLSLVDRGQLESALVNLAVNARDAMPQGGRLTITTGNAVLSREDARRRNEVTPGEYVVVTVSDTGAGMTAEVLEHAFEPFYTTKGVGHGTGLGLSQVYGFVKQSHGDVELDSQVGGGTTVKLYFPRTDAPVQAAQPAIAAADATLPTGSETVLVVEDDADVRGFTAAAVRSLGYTVLEAADAASALATLETRRDITLLLTDVGLPGMNGAELAETAKRSQSSLKVIFTSGYAETRIMDLGLLESGVHFLPKPFGIAALASVLRSALDAAQRV